MVTFKGVLKFIDVFDGSIRLRFQYFRDNAIIPTGKLGDYDVVMVEPRKVIGKTIPQIKVFIENLIKSRCDSLVLNEYTKTLGLIHPSKEASQIKATEIYNAIEPSMSLFTDMEILVSSTSVKIDSNSDGFFDCVVTINTDGTKTVKTIPDELIG